MSGSLRELAALFLRLGATAFGGPAAHIAMMEDEVVRRRQWLSRDEFLDLLGATNLIPGPNSTELAIHIGFRRGGWSGLLVAGTSFILPAFIIVLVISWAYVTYGNLPSVHGILYGVKPVVITVVLQALWMLTRTAAKSRFLVLAGLIAVTLSFLGVHELLVLFGVGLAAVLWRWSTSAIPRRHKSSTTMLGLVPGFVAAPTLGAAVATTAPYGIIPLFWFFLKVGSVLFGSGYVLLAFLRADLVERWGWLSESQLLDAVAVGQITPGPVFTTATFIGYILGGPFAATIATIGIFFPAFFFVALSSPFIPRLRNSPTAGALLDGVNVASLALMIVVTWQLGRAALVDWVTIALTLISALLLMRWRVNSSWLILGGAVVGLALHPR